MNTGESMYHPTAERLEALIEGTLDPGEAVVVESHVLGCAQCETEAEELRALFDALGRMGHFSPSHGFADRVMLQVRLPDPWYVRAGQALQTFIPRTRRGWAFASSMLAIPVVSFTALVLWLLSRPYVTSEGLVAFTWDRLSGGASDTISELGTALLQSNFALWFARGVELLLGAGVRGAGTAAVVMAAMMAASAWILYKNLFRSPNRRSDHVSYSF